MKKADPSHRITILERNRRDDTFGFGVVFSDATLENFAEADLVLGADGVNSLVRAHYAEHFGPRIDWRPNRFVWLGTTFPYSAFTFLFKEDRHGLWRVHAYRYDATYSTFILETTEETW